MRLIGFQPRCREHASLYYWKIVGNLKATFKSCCLRALFSGAESLPQWRTVLHCGKLSAPENRARKQHKGTAVKALQWRMFAYCLPVQWTRNRRYHWTWIRRPPTRLERKINEILHGHCLKELIKLLAKSNKLNIAQQNNTIGEEESLYTHGVRQWECPFV